MRCPQSRQTTKNPVRSIHAFKRFNWPNYTKHSDLVFSHCTFPLFVAIFQIHFERKNERFSIRALHNIKCGLAKHWNAWTHARFSNWMDVLLYCIIYQNRAVNEHKFIGKKDSSQFGKLSQKYNWIIFNLKCNLYKIELAKCMTYILIGNINQVHFVWISITSLQVWYFFQFHRFFSF